MLERLEHKGIAMAKRQSIRWIIGGGVIATAVVAMSFLNLGDNLVYFYTPSEAYAKALNLDGQTIKVGGMVKGGSVVWKAEQLSLAFTMSDMKGHDITVQHTGTPPDMFKEGQGVVVEGRLSADGKSMISRNLMVKHSEEYAKPGDHASMDRALLEKSLFKDQAE
jgi:cytochrome c-type biogenesis protein CcmE